MALPWDTIPEKAARVIAIEGVVQTPNVVAVDPVFIPPNATEAHVRLTYRGLYMGEITSTIFLNSKVTSVTGGFAYADLEAPKYDAHWRPGDDADLWVTIKILKPRATIGATFKCNFGGAGLAGAFAVWFKVADGAVNKLPTQMPKHRARWTIDLSKATPDNKLDISKFVATESGYYLPSEPAKRGITKDTPGAAPCWYNRLSFGDTGGSYYSSNGQNGLYATPYHFPAVFTDEYGGRPSYSIETDHAGRSFIRLPTQRLKKPYVYANIPFPFQASVISTLKMPSWCHQSGVWSYWGVLPSQLGVWHSGWLQGVNLKTMSHRWCPEYDQDEEFGGVYNEGPAPDLISSTQHVGYHGAGARARDPVGVGQYMRRDGFAPDHDFWQQIHRITTVIDDMWVTTYVDGVEYAQARNMLLDESPDPINDPWGFFFKLNVGVKYDPAKPWGTPKETDRLLYGYEHFPLDSGYVISNFLDPMPYAPRQILPGPYDAGIPNPEPVPEQWQDKWDSWVDWTAKTSSPDFTALLTAKYITLPKNLGQGICYMFDGEHSGTLSGGYWCLLAFNDGSDNNRHMVYREGVAKVIRELNNNAYSVSQNFGTWFGAPQQLKVAGAFAVGYDEFALNGAVVSSGSTGSTIGAGATKIIKLGVGTRGFTAQYDLTSLVKRRLGIKWGPGTKEQFAIAVAQLKAI